MELYSIFDYRKQDWMGKGLKIVKIHKRAIYKYVYTVAMSSA